MRQMDPIIDPEGLIDAQALYGELKVTGSRCQCRNCGAYFNSVSAFDKHRKGPAGARTCDLSDMYLNGAGYVVTALRELN